MEDGLGWRMDLDGAVGWSINSDWNKIYQIAGRLKSFCDFSCIFMNVEDIPGELEKSLRV